MMLVSLLSYIDRNVLALLAPTILGETGLSAEQYGWIISAFSIAYMIGNPVWGRVLDRVGLRAGMLAAVAVWSAASTAHALAAGFVGFAIARALLGFGEGATFPGGLRAATQTLPVEERARGIAVAYSGGSLGAMVTPIVITPIALRWGWRAAFVATGLAGAAWLVLWTVLSRAPSVNARAQSTVGAPPRLRDRRLWGFACVYGLGAMPLGFVLYSAPIQLHDQLGLGQRALGHWLWLPPLGWEVGYFVWGWLMDRKQPRSSTMFVLLALGSLPLALTPYAHHLWAALAHLWLAMFVASGFVIVGIAYATRIFSTAHAALIAGIGAGSWSAAVAVAMPFFGRLFDRHLYARAFTIAALVPAVGVLLWRALVVDDRRLIKIA
jgi:ACS family hexuronate transporter-like MFS transporter